MTTDICEKIENDGKNTQITQIPQKNNQTFF